jgi:hypothetical protein
MTEKKAGLENVINNTVNDRVNDIDTKTDEADDADDEMSITESEDIRSINVMIYDDVESEFGEEVDIELGEHETNKLNNNKLNVNNNINYFNDYILVPIHVIYDYCKIIYDYINIF